MKRIVLAFAAFAFMEISFSPPEPREGFPDLSGAEFTLKPVLFAASKPIVCLDSRSV